MIRCLLGGEAAPTQAAASTRPEAELVAEGFHPRLPFSSERCAQFLVMAPDGRAVRNAFSALVEAAVASSLYATVVPLSTQGSFKS